MVLLWAGVCLTGFSQSYTGYSYDNYAGVNTLLLNPAMAAGSKYKVNVNLISVSASAGNNAYEMDRSRLLGLHFSQLSDGNGYYKAGNTDYKYFYLNTDILGPSALITLDRRDGLGLITRMRVIGNEYNLSNGLFQLLGNPNPGFYSVDITNRSLQTKMMSFAEGGLSFSRILMKAPHAQLKAGITAKYISGLAYASLSSGQMVVNIDPAKNIAKLNADISARYSSNLDNLGNGSFSDAFNKQSGHGWGLDLGIVYEWRPAGAPGDDSAAEQTGWLQNDRTPYKLRFGLSVTDLGSVDYTNSPNGQTYTMNAAGHNAAELQIQNNETFSQYFNRLQTAGIIIPKAGGSKLNVKLPVAVHVNMDWHVYKRLFVNGDVVLNTVANTSILTPNYVTTFMMTPRLEKKWLSIYSPVSYNVEGQMTWGAGIRIGYLYAGSGTVLSTLLKSRVQTADFHIGLNIPIFQTERSKKKATDTLYKRVLVTHDRDGDGVVDEKDACPDSAGPIALIGCPDRDGDGVPDYKDKCPDVKGSPNFQGCPAPDTDGDGVNDDDDKCPLVKGVASNHGCPPIKPEVIRAVKGAADRVFFVRAKAVIEKNCLPELDRVVTILQADTTLRLRIEGHTDSEGTDERNQSLSTRRARAVYKYLVSQGISASRMEYAAYGSKRPLASNETPEGMAQNRRVDMMLSNWK